jgi:hypothetical protein
LSPRPIRILLSIAGLSALTLVAHRFVPVNATTVGFAYLLLVLLVASTWGFIEASILSLAATIAFNLFFLPPVGNLTIADPQNWVALFTFLTTSLIASRLSTMARQRASDAVERQQDIERQFCSLKAPSPFLESLSGNWQRSFNWNQPFYMTGEQRSFTEPGHRSCRVWTISFKAPL